MQAKKNQSHNLTAEQLRDLQLNQVDGTQEKVKANKDSSIEINKADEHLVHAEIEVKQFSSTDGTKTSVPVIQNFYPHEFDSMEKQNAFGGKSVRIVHMPDGYKLPKDAAEKGTQATGAGEGAKEKALSSMNKAELQAKYKELWGEEADTEATKPELIDAINEAIEKNKTAGAGEGANA